MSVDGVARRCVTVVLIGAAGITELSDASEQTPPTYYSDIQPILARHCVRCHQAGGGAPMSLTDYAEVRPWARSIEREVVAARMPPWFAAPDVGRFANEARLTDRARTLLLDWARAGAPPGERVEPAPFERIRDGWRIGTPELVVEMPQPFRVPASGEVDYVYIRLPLPSAEDRWVRAVEVLPGEPDLIHHVDVFVCPRGCEDFDELEPGVPSFLPRTPPVERSAQNDTGEFFGLDIEMVFSHLPGGDPWVLPPSRGRLLPGGGEMLLNLHYTTNGRAAADITRVGFVFQREAPSERVVTIGVDNESLWIPAGAPAHEARATITTARALELLALTPHMHLRGRSFEVTAALPDRTPRPLLSVPEWDFNWQLTYVLDRPIALPPSTELRMRAVFDNSRANRWNPDPSRDVAWGRQVTDEMMTAWVEVAFPVDADPASLLAPRGR